MHITNYVSVITKILKNGIGVNNLNKVYYKFFDVAKPFASQMTLRRKEV